MFPRSRCSLESANGTTFPPEAEGNCGEAACFPAPVSRWSQPAEQKGILLEQYEKDNNGSRPRSREASAVQRATLPEQEKVVGRQSN
ncbi:MAG: hypothetical protein LBQ54_03820 [Planctomycetaceae bacterium]|nr:hypothetical protein [Planctomycetaceae bacterium]